MEILITPNPEYPSALLSCEGFSCPAVVGKNGVVSAEEKTEGDGKTPLGTFRILGVYYRPDRLKKPKTMLPALEITKGDIWVDDPSSPLYNQPAKDAEVLAGTSHENLYREDYLYDIFLDLDFNRKPAVPGRGSAIFLHCSWDTNYPANNPTAGCVAIKKEDLLDLIPRIDNKARITVTS
jgi:L,D-peptidoglycan transpeptidase YkuD (ErfK/YbiS/YcfS/YnhG family)